MSQQTFRIDSIRIDDICRTERYYTATLLPLILLNEDFSGLLTFLETLASKGVQAVKVRNQAPTALWSDEKLGSHYFHRNLHRTCLWKVELRGLVDETTLEISSNRLTLNPGIWRAFLGLFWANSAVCCRRYTVKLYQICGFAVSDSLLYVRS